MTEDADAELKGWFRLVAAERLGRAEEAATKSLSDAIRLLLVINGGGLLAISTTMAALAGSASPVAVASLRYPVAGFVLGLALTVMVAILAHVQALKSVNARLEDLVEQTIGSKEVLAPWAFWVYLLGLSAATTFGVGSLVWAFTDITAMLAVPTPPA